MAAFTRALLYFYLLNKTGGVRDGVDRCRSGTRWTAVRDDVVIRSEEQQRAVTSTSQRQSPAPPTDVVRTRPTSNADNIVTTASATPSLVSTYRCASDKTLPGLSSLPPPGIRHPAAATLSTSAGRNRRYRSPSSSKTSVRPPTSPTATVVLCRHGSSTSCREGQQFTVTR